MKTKRVFGTIFGACAALAGMLLIKKLADEDRGKYSSSWFASLSDEEFYAEREPVRKKARENGGDDAAEVLLRRFDEEENRRLNERYMREHPESKRVYREHGWYLPNDD